MTRAVIRQLRRRSLALAWSAKRPKTATLVLSSKTWWPQSEPRCQRTSLLVFSRALKKRSTKQINKKGLPLDSISNKVCKNHPQLNKTWALLRRQLKNCVLLSQESLVRRVSHPRRLTCSKNRILQSIWGARITRLWLVSSQPVQQLKKTPRLKLQRRALEKNQIIHQWSVRPMLKTCPSSTR